MLREHVESTDAETFAEEVRSYNQTLPKGVRKRKPEVMRTWFGCDTAKNRQRYREYVGRGGSIGLSYESWLKYCLNDKIDEDEEELIMGA